MGSGECSAVGVRRGGTGVDAGNCGLCGCGWLWCVDGRGRSLDVSTEAQPACLAREAAPALPAPGIVVVGR
eukprot:10125399-Prorocentrum_lima.AAC.1